MRDRTKGNKQTDARAAGADACTKQSRRQFAKRVSAALLSAPLASSLAQSQTTTKPKEASAPPNPQPSPAPSTPSPLAEAYADVARARFADRLTPEQMEQVRKDLAGNVETADRLRKVKLRNEDEPDFVFIA